MSDSDLPNPITTKPKISLDAPIRYKIQPTDSCLGDDYFEVGKEYWFDEDQPLIIYDTGFHCCPNFLFGIYYYGNHPSYKYMKVQIGDIFKSDREETGLAVDTAFCSNEIKILEEVSYDDAMASITPRMCWETVKDCGQCLKYIPKDMRSFTVCLAAVKNDETAMRFVPKYLRANLNIFIENEYESDDDKPLIML
jgi:hypothetical protein